MKTRSAVRVEIHKLKTLPPLPEATRKILLAINDPTISLRQLADVLEENPSLVARLLGLANSAYFGRSGRIHTLQDAVIQVLGLNMVKSVTSTMLLRDFLDAKKCRAFDGKRFWFCAMLTASLAQDLAPHVRSANPLQGAVAHAAGLMVNLGLLALVCTFPEAMDQVLNECRDSDRPVSAVLREWSELDQYQVGGWLVLRWHLPEVYARVIIERNNPDYAGEDRDLVRLVGFCADLAADIYTKRELLSYSDRGNGALGISPVELKRAVDRNVKLLDQMMQAMSG